ncbi:MAG: hypothetical protein HFF39_01825 [Lawsonibacter sp.]|nr:hypothetical protein [Lawsonibacter sp.]
MTELLSGLARELLRNLPLYPILALFTFLLARRCASWRLGKVLCLFALAALGAGAVYGLLRASGVILYPDDRTWSAFFHDSSNREEGFGLAAPCLLALAAVLPAVWKPSLTEHHDE